MVDAALVSSAVGVDVRCPASPPAVIVSPRLSARTASPVAGVRIAAAGRLEVVRESFRLQGLSEPLVALLLAGSRASTHATYGSAWSNWSNWCLRRGENPLSSSLNGVLEFLASLHASGKAYSTINVRRSETTRPCLCRFWRTKRLH